MANTDNTVSVEETLVDKHKVDMYIITNRKYFPAEKIVFIKHKLYALDEKKFSLLSQVELKDPTTLLIVSLFLGQFGVDRFMLNDTSMGIVKLLTGGCCGILTLIDWFNVQKKTKEMNFINIMSLY